MGIERSRWFCGAFLSAGVVACASLALGGDEAPSKAQMIPDVETTLLRVEVVVLDKDGRPVKGLTADDFQVFEDGRLQTISHFQPAFDGSAPTLPAAADDETGAAAAPAPPPRHIVLAIDDLHLSSNGLSGCKEALKRFLTQEVSDEDEVALITTSGNLGLYQSFTKERVALRRAIDRLAYAEIRGNAGGRTEMSEYEAEAIDRNEPEALNEAIQEITQRDALFAPTPLGAVENPRHPLEAKGMAAGILGQALQATNRTLAALEKVVRSLGSVPGHKVLVLISDGFVIGQGTNDPRAFDMRRIFDASARTGVTVYALDGTGLEASPSGGAVWEPALRDRSNPAGREGYRRAGDIMRRANMNSLAEGTGGFLVHGTNDLPAALDRIMRDADSCYLLAYAPSSADHDGRYHSIEVKVLRRPDLAVRARKGYFAPEKGRGTIVAASAPGRDVQKDEELQTALGSLAPLRGIPLQMAVDFIDLPPDGPQIVVKAHVDVNGIPVRQEGDRHRATVEFLGVVYDETGAPVGRVDGDRVDMNMTQGTYEQLLKDGLQYEKKVPLKPGYYQVRLAARESFSSRIASANAWIEVPDVAQGSLTLSGLFLYAEGGAAASAASATLPAASTRVGGLRDVQAAKRFDLGGSLYYFLYVYNPSRDYQGSTDVVLQAQVWAGSKLEGASPIQPVAFGEGRAPRPVTGLISLEGLAAGDHELRVVISDRNAHSNSLRRVTFTVGS
jgi:VWFA-related protein